MRRSILSRTIIASLTAFSLAACGVPGGPSSGEPRTVAARSASDQRTGDQTHPQIMQQFGGEISDRKLKAYVDSIGRRIVPHTEQPNAKWTFTVLDSPIVNAFALPGGYVYVTRGLLALANDEAELAGVIGHEIGHVTASHSADRQTQSVLAQVGMVGAAIFASSMGMSPEFVNLLNQGTSTVAQGYVASYSRTQEFDADKLGVRYITLAGYDPLAQADFLASLQAESELQSRIAGGSYNPNRVDFFASHPATAERVREAIKAGGGARNTGAPRNQDTYFSNINGMVYGDSPEQGIVQGRSFVHPVLRFRFSVPANFTIRNSDSSVTAVGPQGSAIIFDGASNPGGSMENYIARQWAPSIAKQTRTGQLQQLRRQNIGGLEAATAVMPVETKNGIRIMHMTAISDGNRIWRFTGLQPQGADRLGRQMEGAAETFTKISASEASRVKSQKITIHTVRQGETVASLAEQTSFSDHKLERFLVLNGLKRGQGLQPGDKVKLIR